MSESELVLNESSAQAAILETLPETNDQAAGSHTGMVQVQGSLAVESSFTATRSVAVQCGHESEGTMAEKEHAMQKEFEELKSQQIMMDEEMLEKERELTQLHHQLGQLQGKDQVLSTSGSPSTSVASSRQSLTSPAPHWSPAKPEVSLLQTLLNESFYLFCMVLSSAICNFYDHAWLNTDHCYAQP